MQHCALYLLLMPGIGLAQASAQATWSLEISSSVELRTLKLTNKAEQDTKPLKGATIALYDGATVIKQVVSGSSGDFSVMVPPDGEFAIVVSYPGCNAKKFFVSTKGVPETYDKEGWFPNFPIGGVIMARPLYSIDYAALKQPMVKVVFKQKGKVFDDDGVYTNEVLGKLRKIKSDEDDLIARFLEAVQAGDVALKKPDCPLAKAMYEKALQLIPGEEYPTGQLAKVGDCLVEKEKQDKVVAIEADKKRQEEAAKQKTKEARRAKEVAQAEKFAKEKADNKAKQKLAVEVAEKTPAEKTTRVQEEKIAAPKTVEKKPLTKADKTLPADNKGKQKKESEKPTATPQAVQGTASSGPIKKEVPVSSAGGGGTVKSKKSRHSTPQVIGTSQYQKLISEADQKFAEKDFVRAKVLYNKALDLKPADAHATGRLDEIKRLDSKKQSE